MARASTDEQLVLPHQGLCDDGADATWTEQLCERDQQMDGKDQEVAHGANRIMAAHVCKTIPNWRIPSYCEFATDTLSIMANANLRS
jgi:hypothetical protein